MSNIPSTTAVVFNNDAFHSLVGEFSQIYERRPIVTPKDANPLYELLRSYISSSLDWSRYAYEDPSKICTRNLVDEGNGRFNVIIQVWNPSKSSPIVSNASHSITKVLQGHLKVTRYVPPALPTHRIVHSIWSTASTPSSSRSNTNDSGDETEKEAYKPEERALRKAGERVYARDEVFYIAPSIPGREEMWKFENTCVGEVVVTLHLNTSLDPSTESYRIFDEKTGRKRHATQDAYHSKFGHKVSKSQPVENPIQMFGD